MAAINGLQPLWKDGDIKRLFEKKGVEIERATLLLLAKTGEEFVMLARSIRTYTDRTGNLRSSTGYAILRNGALLKSFFKEADVGEPDKKDGKQGVSKARELIGKIQGDYPNGYVLIVFAGMNYAAAVEARGYDVITHSAEKSTDMLMEEAKNILRKIRAYG